MQINISRKLYNLCPAVPRMLYEPHRVNRENMVSNIIKLLDSRRTLMVSGVHQYNVYKNSQIGKTYTIKTRLIPALRQKGLDVRYINISGLLVQWTKDSSGIFHFDDQYKIFNGHEDIVIVDEAHDIIPEIAASSALSVYADRNELSQKFWEEMNTIFKNNGKCIFVSAYHPLNDFYAIKLFDDTTSLVINSPVIELETR